MVVHQHGSWKSWAGRAVVVGTVVLTACTGADSNSGGKNLRYGYDLEAQFTNTFDPATSCWSGKRRR